MEKRRRFDVPEAIREGQRGYNRAIRLGEEPTPAQREAHAAYEQLRWGQLTEAQRRAAASESNATRQARERIFGRPPTVASAQARYRALVRLITLHRKQFERLLEEEESAQADVA